MLKSPTSKASHKKSKTDALQSQTSNPKLTPAYLFNQAMLARTRIYRLFPPTPLEFYSMPGDWRMLLKREDLSEIHSYKWRGAFNFISAKYEEAKKYGLVAASAGNHAQGVAISASKLGLMAHLFMPKSAPRLKIDSVARLGGTMVEIHLEGDTFDDSAKAAEEFSKRKGFLLVPPYDHELVMAGQGVLGDEMMTSLERPEVVFVQIGGGGLASGMAAVIKTYDPNIKIIGVEEEGQASMKAAFDAGGPVTLPHVDIFCDGTAVKRAGARTYSILKALLDDLVVVTSQQVTEAMEEMWRTARVLAEPSGVLGLAAARQYASDLSGKKVGVVLSGANLDFRRLGSIARKSGDPTTRQAFYRVKIPERQGSMLAFFKSIATLGLNICHLMVGQNDTEIAFPVIGFDGQPHQFQALEEILKSSGHVFSDVTARPDLPFRIAPFQPNLFKLPFAAILEFPERPGALSEFLERIATICNISYFNYVHTGEQVGRALAVFCFENRHQRKKFKETLKTFGPQYTSLPPETTLALGLGDQDESDDMED
ncbi:MAG: pyridoxal-phosphate dependent enzyme [Deltaproteobacteria bacterium]|jgi:threonine dehydratase|nr:pyridoxal-phosphate dependent enzyme [Deltaproteobacteria bacterium]